MKQPLAFRLKPQSLTDIIGQKHLVGENGIIYKMIKEGVIFSMIFYGPPGIGKTSLAIAIANELKKPFRFFNATTDNKKDLDAIFLEAKLANGLVLICDEVHRLNKAKQDLLLPHVEDGTITLIGATTANPYFSINPAIRSRLHLFELKPLTNEDITDAILNAIRDPRGLNNEVTIEKEAINYIVKVSNGDLRFALNILELASIDNKHIDLNSVSKHNTFINNDSFSGEDGHYNLLSAFQKSIRGSDANAALYYLALLAQSGDLESIVRRLLVIAYEDIGLANPALCARTMPACEAALHVGFPEAMLPLGVHIIDLCLSPKSRTSTDATHQASSLVNSKAFHIPEYLHLTRVNPDVSYNYDRYDCFHKIQYLPDELKDIDLLHFGKNSYEKALARNYEELKKIKRTKDLKRLYDEH